MILQIKRGNRVIAESADFSYSPSLQEVRKLTCEVVSVVPIEFKAYNSKSESEYDTVVYNGNTFILYQAPSGDNLNEAGKYKYSLLFYGKEVLLQNVAFLDIVSGTGGEINKIRYTHGGLFQFWGDAKQLAARIEANIESYNASLGAGYTGIGTWTLNVDAEGELTEDMIDITDGTNLFEALKNFYDKFYLNYYFSTTANGGIITITDKARPSVNWTFKQGDGGGAVKVSSSVDTSTPVITRIIPQGGSRNVPPEYKKDAKPADESRYCPYILLPNDSDGNIRYYIDSEYGLKNYGVRGKTISNTFSGIYPSIRGKKLGDLYPSGLPEWDTYKADGEPDPQSGKVAGEGASASTRIDKIVGSTPIKSDDSDSFFIYMTSPGFNLGYKVYEDGDSSDKINDNVQPQYKPHALFDNYRDFESFDIYGTRAYYDQPVKVTASFSGKMLFSILPIGSDALGKKVKINLRMVTNRVLGQASPLKEVVIGEEGATGMLEIPYDKTALVGYIEKGQNTTVTIRVEFTFDSDVPAESCKIGFSEEMTCNIHFGNQDGSQDRFYYKYASVTDAVFSMRTGTYTGTEFKINKNGIIPLYGEVNGDTGETEEDVAMFNKGARYKISCYRTDSDNAKLPLYTDGKSPSIAAGTEFVILNIVMPESYVTMAENTLEKAALDYLSRYDHENRTVSLDISSGFVAEHPNLFIDFIEGNMLKVRDDGIGVFDFSDNGQIVDMQLQIQSLEIKYSKENMFPSYSCTIARRKILSFYERLAQENQTASTQNTTNVTLGGSGTESDNLAELLALKADKTITISAGTGLTGGGNLSANRTLSLATTGVKAGTYTKVTVDTYGRVTVGDNPTTLAGYGITDAVTLTTNQTISGQKTFTKNILMNSGIGLSYGGNTVFRNTAGNTVISSYGNEGMIYFRPNGDTSDDGVIQINKQGHLNGVSAGFTGGVSAARLTANEYIQIGDAQLVYDSANKALRVKHRTDGNTVGFYSDGWVSALGVKTGGSGGGSGVVNTVYSFANLTDGTTFSDSDLDNTFNAYTIKKLYDMAGQGGLDADAMWAELKKADSSKIIDASHIPTSVLDGRWVKKTGDTMTGTLTSASTTGSIIFKGLENCDITNIYTNNGTLYSDTNLAIRNGLRFNWYDTYWYIGNLRGAGTNSSGFGIANESNKLCLQVTPDYTTAPVFRSSASQGTAPLIVYSTTQVSNLNADLLDDKHGAYYQNRVYDTFVSQYTQYDYIEFLRFVIPSGQNQLRAYVVFDLCRTETGNESSGRAVLRLRRNTDNTAGTLFYVTNFGRSTLPELRCTSDDGITWRIWMKCNKSGYDPYIAVKIVEQYPYGYVTTQNNGTTGTPEGTRHVFTALSAGISNAANFLVNSRTLWGQPFNGTANVSGDMTGVGSITMSGDLKIGNATSPNTIYFYGTTGDGPGSYSHTFIAERIWGGTECSELVLFKGNDLGNGTDAITVSNSGPDRIRHIAAAHLFQTYTTGLSGSVESVCTSSALKNLFSIASNRVISYVQLQSTIVSGVAPFIVASNTVVSNLNADLLDGQHLSDLDGRYVNVTGDTMTGDLTMNNTKGFNIGSGTRVVKTSGGWIHGGSDTASSTDANLRFGSWNGIGWYPTISGQTVTQGNNAMWLNVRNGNLDTHGAITAHNGYLAANWDSARRLVLGGGSSYAWIDSRNSSNNVLCNIVLQDNKVVIGNYAESRRFVSTVGTGTQPYQCSSTTLNNNLNADLLDGYHQGSFMRTNGVNQYVTLTGGNGNTAGYRLILDVTISGGWSINGITLLVNSRHSGTGILSIVFHTTNEANTAYAGGINYYGNTTSLYTSTWRMFYNTSTKRLRLFWYYADYNDCYVTILNGRRYLTDIANATWYTSLPSDIGSELPTNYNAVDKLITGRTINGTTFDGTANITTSYWGTTRTFYTNSHDSYRASAGVNVNGSGNVTLLLPNSIRCSDWFRSTGNTGWYHENYGGGWYMTDANYIRNYNSKRLRIQTDTYDTIQLVRTSGSGGSSIAFYNGGGTFRGQFGMNATSWFTFDTGTATANQNVVEISPAGGIHSKAEITAKASGSDIRLKKDIQNYNAMDIINKFRSVKYHWNDVAKANSEVYNNDYDQFGLIAQDLIAGGFKQWVRDVFHDYYTVTYERLIPVVWKGLQEVDDEVTKLRKEVVRLNKRISELEKFLCA